MGSSDSKPETQAVLQGTGSSVSVDSIYGFYTDQLYPALVSSLPILAQRVSRDSRYFIGTAWHSFVQFILPKWHHQPRHHFLWLHLGNESTHPFPNPAEFILRYFDTNADGHISAAELLNMTEIMEQSSYYSHAMKTMLQYDGDTTWWTWFSREWPLMDWKIGVFLWRTFGGILLLIAMCSIIPGRIHGWSARLLRWPVLALTYFLIAVELIVYTVIRLFIRLAEYVIARPRHRTLRRRMAKATTYAEWYAHAAALDASQRREVWLRVDDGPTVSSRRYNWAFVHELMADLARARQRGDSLLALAVLQQCTRKNVGGIMSEDLFAYSNTGAPKYIVSQFVEQVAITIRWVTEEAMKVTTGEQGDDEFAKESYDERLQRKVRKEKDKLWSSLLDATLSFLDRNKYSSNGGSADAYNEIDRDDFKMTPNINMSTSSDRSTGSNGDNTVAPASSLPACHRQEVLAFLKRARAAYGRTALCLSGGAMMGCYHFGHVLGLLEAGLLPSIISGTSAGSVIGAIICTRTEEEVRRDLTPAVLATKMKCFSRPWSERIKSVLRTGHMFSFDEWMDMMQWYVYLRQWNVAVRLHIQSNMIRATYMLPSGLPAGI
jgi:hypothetical protein